MYDICVVDTHAIHDIIYANFKGEEEGPSQAKKAKVDDKAKGEFWSTVYI